MPVFWEDSYMGQLRKIVGTRMIIAPGARAIIRDENGGILFVRRSDNGAWVMPAGGLEIGESIYDCLKREVQEETGLEVISAIPIAIYSEPRFEYINSFGAQNKMLAVVFLVEEWQGELATRTNETTDAQFFNIDELPEIPRLYRETIEDLENYTITGRVILK